MSDTATLTYVYAIARPPGPEDATKVPGVDDATVRLVSSDDLVAIVSTVPEEAFDEAALRARLEEMEMLEALARAHHTVIDAAAANDVVLPLRLATVYRSDGRVLDMLRRGRERFTAALERLVDRNEWGVKVYAEPAEAAGAVRSPAPSAAGANPGKDYLRRRKEERRSADEMRRATAEFAGRVDAALCTLAADVRHYRPQNPQLSGARGENVLNAAYLVDAGRAGPFADAVRELNGAVPGTRVELTGPWAPYSFTLEPAESP